jgi:hypothetical protein
MCRGGELTDSLNAPNGRDAYQTFSERGGVANGKGAARVSEAQQLPGWSSVGAYVRRNPYWLIAKRKRGRLEVLTTGLAGGRRVLPVFSFEEEANVYLRHGIRGSWQLRQTQAGELVSLLYSLCSNVELVALDPMSDVETEVMNGLVSLERERFVEVLLCRAISRCSLGTPALDSGRSACAQTKGAVS